MANNLKGEKLPPVAERNLASIMARRGIAPRAIKVQNPEYGALRRQQGYFGLCSAVVGTATHVDMVNMNDDMVAYCYHYFGPNAYESLSVFLFGEIAGSSDLVFDIGAFTGLFGLVAGRANPSAGIHVFEPIPETASRARLNAEVNHLANVQVHQLAISDAARTSSLNIYGASMATTGASLGEKSIKTIGQIDVEVVSIDGFMDEVGAGRALDLVKLDTEGDEVNALRGGAKTIERCRPIILCEVLTDQAVAAVLSEFRSWNYDLYYISESSLTLVPVHVGGAAKAFSVSRHGYGNLLACPAEKFASLVEPAMSKAAAQIGWEDELSVEDLA